MTKGEELAQSKFMPMRCACGSTRLNIKHEDAELGGHEIMTINIRCLNCKKEDFSFLLDGREITREGKSGQWIPKESLIDYLMTSKVGDKTEVRKEERSLGVRKKPPRYMSEVERQNSVRLSSAWIELRESPRILAWVLSWYDGAHKMYEQYSATSHAETDANGYDSPVRKELWLKLRADMEDAGYYYYHYMAVSLLFLPLDGKVTKSIDEHIAELKVLHADLIEAFVSGKDVMEMTTVPIPLYEPMKEKFERENPECTYTDRGDGNITISIPTTGHTS